MALALRTHTLPSQWLAEDDMTIATALELLHEEDERQRQGHDGYDGGDDDD